MRPKSLLLLALALGCGLVASIGISQVMDRNGEPHGTLETVPIYVALHNINLGDPIDAEMLSLAGVAQGQGAARRDLEAGRPGRPPPAHRDHRRRADPGRQAAGPGPDRRPDPLDSEGHAAEDDRRRRRKERRRLAGPRRPRRRAAVRPQGRARPASKRPSRKIILQNIRVFAVDQTVQRSPDGGEETARSPRRFR